jgi:hypothetical protein
MELNFTSIEEQDYEILCEFCKFWKFSIPPKNCLPNNGTGGIKIIDENGTIICAGFLYETNSGIAWLEFIVSNPTIRDKKIRHEAQILLISMLTVIAEEKGFTAVFASITNKNLIEKYVEVGYTKNLINSSELYIALK